MYQKLLFCSLCAAFPLLLSAAPEPPAASAPQVELNRKGLEADRFADRAAADASYERIKEDSRITTVFAAHGRPIFFDRPRPVMTPVAD